MKYTIEEIQAMLKLIPNGVSVCLEDLEEIYGIKIRRLAEEDS